MRKWIVAAKLGGERGGLRALPIKQRILIHHRGEAGELGRAPTARAGKRFVDDGHQKIVCGEKEKVNELAVTSEAEEPRGVAGADEGERTGGETREAEFIDLSAGVEERGVGAEEETARGDFLGEPSERV